MGFGAERAVKVETPVSLRVLDVREKRRQRAELESRRASVSTLLLEHKTDKEIADALELPVRVVRRDIEYLLSKWQETQTSNSATYFVTDLKTLDEAQTAIITAVRDGNLASIDRLLDILKRRSDMLGYDRSKAKGGKEDGSRLGKELTNDDLKNLPTEQLAKLEEVIRGFKPVEGVKISADED
jgi:hypothetical protein